MIVLVVPIHTDVQQTILINNVDKQSEIWFLLGACLATMGCDDGYNLE